MTMHTTSAQLRQSITQSVLRDCYTVRMHVVVGH